MTTLAEGGFSPRYCVTHPFGFTAFGYEDPVACQFQSFCPKGMKKLDKFYRNHKGKTFLTFAGLVTRKLSASNLYKTLRSFTKNI
jgi:hypothetical protein